MELVNNDWAHSDDAHWETPDFNFPSSDDDDDEGDAPELEKV